MESIKNINTLNETKRSKTNSNFNKLVPKLIEQSNNLTKELQYRMKLNNFFSEFESKASNQFNFFIKESRTRYLGSRSGCNLDSLIANSRKKCLKEANKIINDNFYSNNDILIEKEKMKYKTTNKMYKKFKDTLFQIKSLSSTNSLSNLSSKNKINFSKKNFKRKKKLFKDEKNISIMSSEKLSKEKNDIKLLLNKENSLFHKTMNNYKNELNSLNSLNDIDKLSYAHKNLHINLPKLNLLTYKKFNPPHIDPDEEEILKRVNFKKLLPFSKLGKNLGYSQKNIKKQNQNIAFITEPKFYFKYGDYMNNVRNTNGLVFDSANMEFNIQSRINKKRKIIEDMLGVDNIPKLDSYELIVKNIFNKRKKERENINKNKLFEIFDVKKEEENFHENSNRKIQKGFNALEEMEKKYLSNIQEDFDKKLIK